MPANILNLPCYKVQGITENEHDYHIDVETLEAPTSCPHCQSSNLVGFGRRVGLLARSSSADASLNLLKWAMGYTATSRTSRCAIPSHG